MKAISEGFQKERLAEVKQQAAEALDIYMRGSYSGFGMNIATGGDISDPHSKSLSENKLPKSPNQSPVICGPDRWPTVKQMAFLTGKLV